MKKHKQLLAIALLYTLAILNIPQAKAQTGEALSFNGSGYVSVNDDASLDMDSAITFQCWVYIDTPSTGGEMCFIDKATPSRINYRFFTRFKKIGFYTALSGGKYSNDTLPDRQWTHITCVLASGNLSFYINGILDTTLAAQLDSVGTSVLRIGRDIIGRPFFGDLDDLRIWNRTLTALEIQENWNCETSSPRAGLVANYHFNSGIAGGTNTADTTLADASGYSNDGKLLGFTLTGATSNWIAPGGTTPAAAITASGATLTATTAGLTYQWIDCSNGNTPVANATNQTYTATANGSYAVIVTDVCSDTSSCQNVTGLGIENPETGLSIDAYPNPAKSEIVVSFTAHKSMNVKITLLDMLGKETVAGSTILNINGSSRHVLNVSALQAGIYFLSFRNEQSYIGSIKVLKAE